MANDTDKDPAYSKTWALLISEILFVFLPLIVLAIVLAYQHRMSGLLRLPEWSFITAILFGQTLVKIVSAAAAGVSQWEWQQVVVIVSAVIVVGFIPSLIILCLVLVSEPPPTWLAIAQLLLFLLSVATFILLGGAGQYALTKRETEQKRT